MRAELTGLHVISEYRVFSHRIDMLEDTRERYAQFAEQHAEQYLGVIVQAAEDASVVVRPSASPVIALMRRSSKLSRRGTAT
ncbi:hypothetical protein [Cupriavidus basilensis]